MTQVLASHGLTVRDVSFRPMPRRPSKQPVADWVADLGKRIADLRGQRGQQWLAEEMAKIRPPKRPGRQSATPGKEPGRGKQAVSNLENGYNVTVETIDTALRALGASLELRVTPADSIDRSRVIDDGGGPMVTRNPGYYRSIGDWWDELSEGEQKQLHRLAESFHESHTSRKVVGGDIPNT